MSKYEKLSLAISILMLIVMVVDFAFTSIPF